MLAIRLDKELGSRLARIAAVTGGNKSSIVRAAVVRYLGDQEDGAQAHRARGALCKTKTIAELREVLGLDR